MAAAERKSHAELTWQPCQLPPELDWNKTFLSLRRSESSGHVRCSSAPAILHTAPIRLSLPLDEMPMDKPNEQPSGRPEPEEEELLEKCDPCCGIDTQVEQFAIGDIVEAADNFSINGSVAVEKGCQGRVKGHGERPDGARGIFIHFEAWKSGRDVDVLCMPAQIELVEKAPSAPSAYDFKIGCAVATTSDFRVGGTPVVDKGCKGIVICHGERPDGTIGISVQFDARLDGGDSHVLCRPHEIEVLSEAPEVQPDPVVQTESDSEPPQENHLSDSHSASRHSVSDEHSYPFSHPMKTATDTLRTLLACDSESAGHEKATTHLKRRKAKQHGHSRSSEQEVDLDDFGEPKKGMMQMGRPWAMFISILVVANLFLAHVHVQRRARREKPYALDILSERTLPAFVSSHHDGVLLNVFASHCKPCDKLAPQLEEAARRLRGKTNVSLVSLDARLAPALLKQYAIKQAPSLLWFRYGRLVKRLPDSVRSVAQIIDFVHESLHSAVIEFSSYDEFTEALPQLRAVLAKGRTPPIVAGFGHRSEVHGLMEQVGAMFRGETAFLFVPESGQTEPHLRAYFRDSAADKDYNGYLTVDAVMQWLYPFMMDY